MDDKAGNSLQSESEITMVDFLKNEEQLEDETAAVLGAGDDNSCTYDQGYMVRQAIYSCQTCLPAGNPHTAGICLGCSFKCHEGHDLVELYTKRHFRCDCGNSNYLETNSCKFIKDKLPVNPENKYNENFRGKYCICNRPYPDLNDTIEDQMIQCILCEDWFHGRHLNCTAPSEEDFSEMICEKCFPQHKFLLHYLGLSVTSSETAKEEKDNVNSKIDVETAVEPEENINNKCELMSLPKQSYTSGAVFFKEDWREQLCLCSSCKTMYSKENVNYLIDPEDTVSNYESKGRARRTREHSAQREIEALSTLDRFTRTEVVHEYNNLSSSLRDYLKKFAENGKVVRDEDIKEFFSELEAKKKSKKDEGMQYYCK